MRWMRTLFGFTIVMLALLCTGSALASETVELTNSGSDLRDGWYPNESSITPSLVTGGTFGQLWETPVKGQVYAQPLLTDNGLFVATEENEIYDLDPATGNENWKAALRGNAWNPGEISCADLTPKIGATATPVIDPSTDTAYLTHKAYLSGSSGAVVWYMDAINLENGSERAGFPVKLEGSAQNVDPEFGAQKFEARTELQRPGLLLLEGVVYAAFGSDCDTVPWQGWVFGVSTAGVVKARWVSDEAGNGAGIWQSGAGLTSDGPGTMLLSTGNGYAPSEPAPGDEPPIDLGESIVRLRVQGDGSLKATDFFTPFDGTSLDTWDADFASGGVTALPDEYFGTSAIPSLAVAVGKDGYVYLLNREHLGGLDQSPEGGDDVVQRLGPYGGVWSRPGVWPGEGGWVYIPTASAGNSDSGSSGNFYMYKYGVSEGTPALSLQSVSKEEFGFSSSAPVITSEGTTAGSALIWMVWAPNGTGEGAQLRAYAPTPVDGQPQLLWSAPVGTSSKFALPGVGAGRLYVGTRDGRVLGFGSPVTPPLTGPATAFPTTTVGDSSEETLTLTATRALTLKTLSSSSPEFKVDPSTPPLEAALKEGESISIPITFAPTGAGPQAATLTATTKEGNTATFSLAGAGQAAAAKLEANPLVVSFGGATVGSEIEETATFKNVGALPLTIEKVDLPEAPFGEIAKSVPQPGSEILPGNEVTVDLTFKPETVGKFESTIELDTTGGNVAVALTGNGATPGVLTISSESNEFGEVAVGTSEEKTFTVANTGGTPIEITLSKPPEGGEFSRKAHELEEATTIQPGESKTETVVFAPTSPGEATGVWKIAGNEVGGHQQEVHFHGVGVPTAAPGVLDEPASAIGEGSATLNATVDPNHLAVSDCHFDYGATSAYGSSVPCAALPGSGEVGVAVSAELEGLEPGAGYHYRIVATNPDGTSHGEDGEFTTLAQDAVPETPATLLPQLPGGFDILASREVSPPYDPDATLAGAAVTASAAGTLSVIVRCPSGAGSCIGTLTLRTLNAVASSGRRPAILTLATGSFSTAAGRATRVRLRLTSRGRQLLAEKHVLRVRATIVAHDPGGTSATTHVIVVIRAPKVPSR